MGFLSFMFNIHFDCICACKMVTDRNDPSAAPLDKLFCNEVAIPPIEGSTTFEGIWDDSIGIIPNPVRVVASNNNKTLASKS